MRIWTATRLARITVALSWGVLAACASPDGRPSAGVRDSAGIRIVTSAAARAAELPLWTVAPAPAATIGVDEGDAPYELSGVTDAVRLADGTLAIANAGTAEIRFFDAEGRFLRQVGGNGEGPGEFRVLWRLFPLANGELAAWDVSLRRLTIFSAADSVRGTWAIDPLATQPSDVRAVLADGSFLVTPEDRYQWNDMDRPRRDSLPFVRWKPDAGIVDTIGRFPGRQQFEMLVPPVQLLEETPFGPATFVAVHGDELWIGDNDRSGIDVVDGGGRRLRIVRLVQEPRAVTADDIARFKRENIDPGWRATYLAAKRRFLEVVPFPDRMPWFGPFLVDPDGDLWLAAYRTTWEERERPAAWWIFDDRGELRARATTPPGLRVVQAGADWLLGVREDETGVEHVELYTYARS